jgi:hypothetical protein
MIHEILLTVIATLIVNEATSFSPWLAIRLARWAAKRIYAANTDRAEQRKEEWEALIKGDSIPANISKLFFGLGFACAGLFCIAIRGLPTVLEAVAELLELPFEILDSDEIGAGISVAWIVLGSSSMPFLRWLIITGAIIGLIFALSIIGDAAGSAAEHLRKTTI